MTAFAGIIAFRCPADQIETEERIGRALLQGRKGRQATGNTGSAIFVQRSTSTTDVSARPLVVADGNALFTVDARLDNRSDLGAALGITTADLARLPDGELILRLFQRWGDAGIARCVGAFAFAHWDETTRRLTLARDCLGNRSLFFHHGDGFVAFATTLGTLLALSSVPRTIDEETLANFLAVNLGETRRTFYCDVERVPSRTRVTIDSTSIEHVTYWSPNLNAPPPYRREHDYIERARELFDEAVAASISDTPHVAVSLSGGFDSSAIAATVARLGRSESITGYALVAPPGFQVDLERSKYLDERDKLEALGRMHPVIQLRTFAPEHPHPDFVDDTRLFARTSMPIFGPTNLGFFGHLHDAIARSGHPALLIGHSGNFGLTWQGSMSLVDLLKTGRWGRAATDLRVIARHEGNSIAQSLVRNVILPLAPLLLRDWIYKRAGREPLDISRYSSLNPNLVEELGLQEKWREQGFDTWFRGIGSDAAAHRAHKLFDHNQFARDFMSTSRDLNQFEIRDPHADRRLLEFALSVPEQMFRRNGIHRSFARAVFADRLPAEILNETRRGAQGVTWFRNLDSRRQDIATELERLEASPLAGRLIDLPRLKRLMREWPTDEQVAQERSLEFRLLLTRGVHVGRFVRWVEGGNA